MYELTAEKRNLALKAKQLRKAGFVPVDVYGGDVEGTILLQVAQGEAKKLLRTVSKGGSLLIRLDEICHNVLLKEVNRVPITGDVESLAFQSLLAGDPVSATAQITLLNKDLVTGMVQKLLNEIPYKALPAALVSKIEIDIGRMKIGDCVKVEDLPLSKDPRIEILIPGESLVLNVVENRAWQTPEETEAEK